MAQGSLKPSPKKQESIPFWRDIRVLGILAQIAFVIFVVLAGIWFVGNIGANLDMLGGSQFICEDGTSKPRCAFDFLSSDAQFDISETPIDYEPTDSYWRAMGAAALNSLKVIALGIVMATTLGTLVGIARLSANWFVRNVSKWYVDLFRNTPLVLQLIFIFFSVLLALPGIEQAIQPLGLPLFISQRGVNYPSLVYTGSAATWLAFLVLAIIQGQVLWVILGRQEERTGAVYNRPAWVITAFFAVATMGWLFAANEANQAILSPTILNIREFDDLEQVALNRFGVNNLSEIETRLAAGEITEEEYEENAISVCGLRDSPSITNLTAQMRSAEIPYTVERESRQGRATEEFADGECDLYAAPTAILAAERDLLEDSGSYALTPIWETPVRISLPRLEGFNFQGGGRMSAEFTAVLLGLVLNTGASIAEIVRAGIQSVSKGQSEAASALGLSDGQRLRLVVLPQALRVIIPPQTSQYLNLAKNSTLAQAVGFPDFWTTSYTVINQSGRAIQVMLIVMSTYLVLSLLISMLLNWYNDRIALVER